MPGISIEPGIVHVNVTSKLIENIKPGMLVSNLVFLMVKHDIKKDGKKIDMEMLERVIMENGGYAISLIPRSMEWNGNGTGDPASPF